MVTPDQARRIALAAQGFGGSRDRVVGIRQVQGVVDRVAQFQIDTINVVERAQYLPLYSRLGPYDKALLDRCTDRAPRRLFEYWGHAASVIDVALQPMLRPRMAAAAEHAWGGVVRLRQEHPDLIERVYDDVAASDRGLTAREIEHDEIRDRTNWGWNWSRVKTALEWLFWAGRITSARRNSSFERVYDLPERVLPAAVLSAPTPSAEEGHRALVRRSLRALGIGSTRCVADYFRLGTADAERALAHLEVAGEVVREPVSGWKHPLWIDPAARRVRRIEGSALVSPFDSLVFERQRLSSLFGVDYRVEIYVPEPKRKFGYYVYLFLLDAQFEARVDLKADRAARELLVQSAWREPSRPADDARVSRALAAELVRMAEWLGLENVAVRPKGDLADALTAALG